tara:strand:+ start:642 stop:968 length:327 start_codon:yes stop_codon:yes gene_type:complete
MFYSGISNVPGAPGNLGAVNNDGQSGRDIVEETRQRQFPQFVPPNMGSSNVNNALPGGQQITGGFGNMQMGNMGGMQMSQMGGAYQPPMAQAPAQVPGQVPPFDNPVR